MSTHHDHDNPSLDEFAAELRLLAPRATSVCRDELMYQAGFAAGQAAVVPNIHPRPTSPLVRLRAFGASPIAALVSSVVAAILGVVVGIQLPMRRDSAPDSPVVVQQSAPPSDGLADNARAVDAIGASNQGNGAALLRSGMSFDDGDGRYDSTHSIVALRSQWREQRSVAFAKDTAAKRGDDGSNSATTQLGYLPLRLKLLHGVDARLN